MEAERRAYGELSRQAWQVVLRTRPSLGYRYDKSGVVSINGKSESLEGDTLTGAPSLAGAVVGPTSGPTAPYSPIPTAAGAAVGDTYGQLLDVYGERLTVTPTDSDAIPGLRWFAVDGDISYETPTGLGGSLRYWPTSQEWPPPLPTAPDGPVSDDYVVVGFGAGQTCPTL